MQLLKSLVGWLFSYKTVRTNIVIERLESDSRCPCNHITSQGNRWVQWKRGKRPIKTAMLLLPKIPRPLSNNDAKYIGSNLFKSVNFPSLKKIDTQYRVHFTYLNIDYALVVDIDQSIRLLRMNERPAWYVYLRNVYWTLYRRYTQRVI